MKKCINLGCAKFVEDSKWACSQDCGYMHYIRKTLDTINRLSDTDKTRSFEFSPEIAKTLIDGYKVGMSTAQLATKTSLSNSLVSKFLFHPTVMTNFKLRKRRTHRGEFTLLERIQICQALDEGKSVVEIAATFNSSLSAVYRVRVEHLKPKPQSLTFFQKVTNFWRKHAYRKQEF